MCAEVANAHVPSAGWPEAEQCCLIVFAISADLGQLPTTCISVPGCVVPIGSSWLGTADARPATSPHCSMLIPPSVPPPASGPRSSRSCTPTAGRTWRPPALCPPPPSTASRGSPRSGPSTSGACWARGRRAARAGGRSSGRSSRCCRPHLPAPFAAAQRPVVA